MQKNTISLSLPGPNTSGKDRLVSEIFDSFSRLNIKQFSANQLQLALNFQCGRFAYLGDAEALEASILAGARIDYSESTLNRFPVFETPFTKAILSNRVDCVKILLKHVDKIGAFEVTNSEPLVEAATQGWTPMCEILCKGGMDVNQKMNNNRTALHQAALRGHFHTCEALIAAGADVHLHDFLGLNPLHCAAKGPRSTAHLCVKLLMDCGANPYKQDHKGMTPLMYAAKEANPISLSFLGADPSLVLIRDKEQQSALDHFAMTFRVHKTPLSDLFDCAEFLIRAGSNPFEAPLITLDHDSNALNNSRLHLNPYEKAKYTLLDDLPSFMRNLHQSLVDADHISKNIETPSQLKTKKNLSL